MGVNKKNRLFGLLGKNISYSFSQSYFSEKFRTLNLKDCQYVNFDLPKVDDFLKIIRENKNLCGMNVTIPYKRQIIPFLSRLDEKARVIGAVNTIRITPTELIGYNTDCYGFETALLPYLKTHHQKALILGSGGASSAVDFALRSLGIAFKYVSRTHHTDYLQYEELTKNIIQDHTIIINCTPLGTFPQVELSPSIPYQYLSDKHLLYDLVYNPPQTTFMLLGKKQGATVVNGYQMLKFQAEKSWKIWQK